VLLPAKRGRNPETRSEDFGRGITLVSGKAWFVLTKRFVAKKRKKTQKNLKIEECKERF